MLLGWDGLPNNSLHKFIVCVFVVIMLFNVSSNTNKYNMI